MLAVRLSLLACLLVVVGCGSGNSEPGGVSIEGTVELNNKALEKGELVLFSNDGKVNIQVPVVAGKFTGKAPPGTYKVVFSATKEMPNPNHSPNTPGSTPTQVVNIIPAKYAADSKETMNVTESGPNKFAYSLR